MNLKNMRECDKSKNTCKQQLPIVYMSFNNVGHLITSRIHSNIILSHIVSCPKWLLPFMFPDKTG